MRILYFSFVELDVPNACRSHTLGVLRGFSLNSCQVDAVIPRPTKGFPNIPGVTFHYLWPWQFSDIGMLWIKILTAFYFLYLCLENKYDALYVRELEINPVPRWYAKLFRIPYYVEVNSILTEIMKMNGADPKKLAAVERHQRADFRQAAGVISPSFPRRRWLIDHYGLDSGKVHLIPNGADVYPKEKLPRCVALERLGLPEDGFYLLYLGLVWKYYDFDTILQAMNLCADTVFGLRLIIIGDGPDLAKIKENARELGLSEQVAYLGYVHPDLLFEVIGAGDIALMNLTKEGLEAAGPISTRFSTYASFGIPVIGCDRYIEAYPKEFGDVMSVVPSENPAALADMIIWLYKHPKERKEKSGSLHRFVMEKLTWTAVTWEILLIMEKEQKNSSE